MKKTFITAIVSILFFVSSGFGEIIRITNNNYKDGNPNVTPEGYVWWYAEPTGTSAEQTIFFYNGSQVIEIAKRDAINGSGINGIYLQLANGKSFEGNSAVYTKKAGAGNYAQVFFFDGQKEIQITNTNYYNFEASICNGYIAWSGFANGDNTADIFLYKPDTTVVKLSELKATPSNTKINVKWKTDSEINNAGFNVWRAEGFKKINPDIIPAQGSATEGSEYDYLDLDVFNLKPYFYLLEDVDNNGISTFHGPVKAVPRALYGISK